MVLNEVCCVHCIDSNVYFPPCKDEEWEKELQAELQDYELGSDGSGQTGGPDADDIEEMLDAEESHGDLK